MREIPVRRMPASTARQIVREGRPVLFYAGKPDARRRVLGLPATARWAPLVKDVYRDVEPIHLDHHTQLDDGVVTRIIVEQVDGEWLPLRYAILSMAGAEVFYIVPDNAYWRGQVGEK